MERQKQINRSRRTGNRQSDRRKRLTILFTHSIRDTNGKVLIAADEVDKWSRLCEGLQTEWECTTVNLDAFEKFHTIAVYDTVLIREKQKIIQKGKLLIDWCYHTVYWGEHELATLNEREKAFLYLLADSSRQVVTHEIIFEQLWKEPYEDDSANMIWCFVRRPDLIIEEYFHAA